MRDVCDFSRANTERENCTRGRKMMNSNLNVSYLYFLIVHFQIQFAADGSVVRGDSRRGRGKGRGGGVSILKIENISYSAH